MVHSFCFFSISSSSFQLQITCTRASCRVFRIFLNSSILPYSAHEQSTHCGHNCIELFRGGGDLCTHTHTNMCMMYICIVYCTNTQTCTIFVCTTMRVRARVRDVRTVDETMNGGRPNVVGRSPIEYACLMGYG